LRSGLDSFSTHLATTGFEKGTQMIKTCHASTATTDWLDELHMSWVDKIHDYVWDGSLSN
jgi:hypothetical protein